MYQFFNPNPCGRAVGDCAVRAIAAAFDVSWEEAFDVLVENARAMCDMPSSDQVWNAVLRQFGFECELILDGCTLGEFAADHPKGTFVVKTPGHVATIIDGVLLDSWDSRSEVVIYVWYRPRERDRRVRNV